MFSRGASTLCQVADLRAETDPMNYGACVEQSCNRIAMPHHGGVKAGLGARWGSDPKCSLDQFKLRSRPTSSVIS